MRSSGCKSCVAIAAVCLWYHAGCMLKMCLISAALAIRCFIFICVIVRLSESNSLLMEYIQTHQSCLRTRPLVTDYLPALRSIAKAEDVRKATTRKRRFKYIVIPLILYFTATYVIYRWHSGISVRRWTSNQ